MRAQKIGAPGRGSRSAPESLLQQHPYKGPSAASQAYAASGRLQRINSRAAQIAQDLSLADAKRALKAYDASEKQELRDSSRVLLAIARSLGEVRA